MSEHPNYWAFISYSHRDAKWGSWLHKELESYRPPKILVGKEGARGTIPKRLSPIFRDREELSSSTDLGASISDALNRSLCQIVICSPASARSKWVNEEILAFKRLGREDRIYCFIVDGEPNASDNPAIAEQECFPPALRYRLGPDGQLGTTRTEPIAADARPGKDGRTNAKLKLIAGLLGVGYDSLRQREAHRRQRKMVLVSSAALTGMVITSGLATWALFQQRRAERETAIARREETKAKETTRFLVDLFKQSDPSEALGNKITAREMLDKGAQRVETDLARQPGVQASLLDTLGSSYKGLGLYVRSQPLLESAIAKQERLIPAEPTALAQSLTDLGDLLTLRADYDGAEKAYRRAIALQRALPDGQRDEVLLAHGLFGLGDELTNRGSYAEAEASLRDALSLQELLLTRPDADMTRMRTETARTLQTLAWTVSERDLNAAIPIMQQAVAMQRENWGTRPHPDLAAAVNDLGLLLSDHGDLEQSEKLLRESLAMHRQAFGERHPELALALNNLGRVQHLRGDLSGAEATYRETLAMQRELLGETHPDVANTLTNLAFVLYDRGNVAGALQAQTDSLAIYRKLFPGDNPDVARTMNQLAYWYIESRDYASAERCIRDALAMRLRLFEKSNPELASSYAYLGILDIARHNYPAALEESRAALALYTAAFSAASWKSGYAESIGGAALAGEGRYEEAERMLLHGYQVLNADAVALPPFRRLAARYLEDLYRSWGKPREALRYASAASPAALRHAD